MDHLINHSVVERPWRSLFDFDNVYGRHTLDRQRRDVLDRTSLTGFFFRCSPWVFHSIIGREGTLLTVFSFGRTLWVSRLIIDREGTFLKVFFSRCTSWVSDVVWCVGEQFSWWASMVHVGVHQLHPLRGLICAPWRCLTLCTSWVSDLCTLKVSNAYTSWVSNWHLVGV